MRNYTTWQPFFEERLIDEVFTDLLKNQLEPVPNHCSVCVMKLLFINHLNNQLCIRFAPTSRDDMEIRI